MLTAAVRSGIVRRARRGWYTTAQSSEPRFRAVQVGGRLTGMSAFQHWGAWVWRSPTTIQIAVPVNAARLRAQHGTVVHYDPARDAGDKVTVSPEDALVRVLLDEPAESSVPCADWLLATGRLDRIDVERCILELPRPARSVAALIDANSQSVIESVARVRLLTAGYRVWSQQRTGLLGSIDLLVEDQVALELDGRAFHEGSFESDRRRDLVTTVEGRHVIRASALMVRDDWPAIAAAVSGALAARRVSNSGRSWMPRVGSQRTHRRGGGVS